MAADTLAPIMPNQVIPPNPTIFRDKANQFRAFPVCRPCVEKHGLPADSLHSYPVAHHCEVRDCENRTSYLYIC